jgi:hypothetical protein
LSVLVLLAGGCADRAAGGSGPFTAERGKEAIVEFIRQNPGTFIGSPDPDRLAALPLGDLGDGKFSLGAFTIDVKRLFYGADIGMEGPEPYLYSGRFALQDGAWRALPPSVMRLHKSRTPE